MGSAASAHKPKRPVWKRLLRLGIFLAIQAVVIVILLEVVCRIFDPAGISYYPQTARLLDTLIEEEPIGYRHRPGMRGRFHGVTVQINSLGLRDRDVPLEPEPNEFRILVMGDSLPFGVGVEEEDSLSRVLELIANERHQGDRHYRTINMGVPSYNTEQELIQLETLGMKLKPNLVVLLFSQNDIEPKMWVLDKRSSLIANLSQRSYAASLLFLLGRQLKLSLGGEVQFINVGDYRVDHPRWRSIDQSLKEMNQLCRSADIPFIVLTYNRQEPLTDWKRLLRMVGEREGFPILNIYPFDDPRWKNEDVRAYRNSRADSHPNKAGCRLYATMMYETLVAQGVLE